MSTWTSESLRNSSEISLSVTSDAFPKYFIVSARDFAVTVTIILKINAQLKY
jgi:hypothetical protein